MAMSPDGGVVARCVPKLSSMAPMVDFRVGFICTE